jgi:hypothetical protein
VAGFGEALAGDVGEGVAHGAVVFAAGEDLEGVFEGFEFGFTDQDAGVVAVVAGDFDASVADDDTLVEVVDRVTELRDLESMETSA